MGQLIAGIFYKQRADFEQQNVTRNDRFVFPEDVQIETDIPYIEDGQAVHRLDVLYPKQRTQEKLPVIVNVHGGGLLMGSKEFNLYFCSLFSRMGYLVFNVEYRLVPDCRLYDQIDDILAAVQYIQGQLLTYHGAAEHIYGVGDSGGACLLVYANAVQCCERVAEAAGVASSGNVFKALGLISGMFYTNRFDQIGLFLPKYLYGKGYKKSAFAPYVNPEHPDIVTALPPCFLVTSQNDNLRHYTIQFQKALKRHGIKNRLVDFAKDPRLTHAFSVFEPELAESRQVIWQISEFIGQY